MQLLESKTYLGHFQPCGQGTENTGIYVLSGNYGFVLAIVSHNTIIKIQKSLLVIFTDDFSSKNELYLCYTDGISMIEANLVTKFCEKRFR